MEPSSLRLSRVETSTDWDRFFEVKHWLYRDDPAAVTPLREMERGMFDASSSAFLEHATLQAWICFDGDRCVGRIAAIIDSLHNEYHQDEVGFFGFFESVDDSNVAGRLIEVAQQWLQKNGKTAMRGPVSPSMKGEFGVVVEGNEHHPTVMLNHSFAYYDGLLKACGFEVAKSFYSFEIESDDSAHDEKYTKIAEFESRVIKRFPKLKIEHATKENFEENVRRVNDLANKVRDDGYGFVPMTMAEVDTMVRNVRSVIRYDMFHLATFEDELVGFIITIPDINWALKKTFFKNDLLRKLQLLFWLRFIPRGRVIALGVDPAFRNKGIAMLLINRVVQTRNAYKEWEFSWVQEDNVKSLRAIERSVNLKRCKTFRVYEKNI